MKIVTALYKEISLHKFSKNIELKQNSGEKPTNQPTKQTNPYRTIPVGSNYSFQAEVSSSLN